MSKAMKSTIIRGFVYVDFYYIQDYSDIKLLFQQRSLDEMT